LIGGELEGAVCHFQGFFTVAGLGTGQQKANSM
jgi:hypothetical protein